MLLQVFHCLVQTLLSLKLIRKVSEFKYVFVRQFISVHKHPLEIVFSDSGLSVSLFVCLFYLKVFFVFTFVLLFYNFVIFVMLIIRVSYSIT